MPCANATGGRGSTKLEELRRTLPARSHPRRDVREVWRFDRACVGGSSARGACPGAGIKVGAMNIGSLAIVGGCRGVGSTRRAFA